MPKEESKWKTVKIPKYLVDLIQNEIVESGKYGYTSISDFVTMAVREKLQKLGYNV